MCPATAAFPPWQIPRLVSQGGATAGPALWVSHLRQQLGLNKGAAPGPTQEKQAQPSLCFGFCQWSV